MALDAGSVARHSSVPALVVENVGVDFGGISVLQGVSLSLQAGESMAVTGPSGSGKSSLLACVTGLIRPTRGSVTTNGIRVFDLSESARAAYRRTQLGLVFQDADLLPELSVEENVALTLLFDGVRRAEALKMARQALGSVGLAEHADKRIDEISGGQAQRVALARALVRPNVVLIVADEPTASLDAENAEHVTSLLLTVAGAAGAAALIATHDPMVAAACDHRLDLRTMVMV